MADILPFPKRKTLIELNQDEIDRATLEFIRANREIEDARRKRKHASDALSELYSERRALLDKER